MSSNNKPGHGEQLYPSPVRRGFARCTVVGSIKQREDARR